MSVISFISLRKSCFVISLGLLLISENSFGVQVESPFSTLSYQLVKISPTDRALERQQISLLAESHGFIDLSMALSWFTKKVGVDQVFASDDLKKVIFVKMNLAPEDKNQVGLLFDGGDSGLVAHGKTEYGSRYAILFSGFSKVELNSILFGLQHGLKSLKGQTQKNRNVSLLRLLLPLAHAQESNNIPECKSPGIWDNLKGLGSAMRNYGRGCLYQAAIGGAGMVGAASTGAIGTVVNVGANYGFAVYNGKVSGNAWQDVRNFWGAFKETVVNFNTVMWDRYQGFFNLPPDKQAEIGCQFLGLAVASIGAVSASGGAALPLTYAAVSAIVQTLSINSDASVALKNLKCRRSDTPPSGGDDHLTSPAVR